MNANIKIQDSNQNFWQLGSILGTALGLPAMLIGGVLNQKYGFFSAVTSIIIGNLILWAIGLSILSMTEGRNHAIANIKDYLGKSAAILNSMILIFAFIFWFSIQIDAPAQIIAHLIKKNIIESRELELRIGAILGFICSLISLGGIRAIRWVCTVGLPFILIYQIYYISKCKVPIPLSWGNLSISGIATIVLLWLPGAINLSTFYRHAQSKVDAFLGLSIMTLIHMLFQLFTVVISIDSPIKILLLFQEQNSFFIFLTSIFLIITFLCINLSNIYFASAGWDTIIPVKFQSSKKYAIMGMLGTLIYTFLQKNIYMNFLERIATNSLACLAVVLVISVILKIALNHRPRSLEKHINAFCWIISCVISMVALIFQPTEPINSLVYGVSSSFIIYLVILFIEETTWALKKINSRKI